jgi:hypothetical protein
VAGGAYHTASGQASAIGGGRSNTASATYTTISGGRLNTASALYGVVGGGQCNINSAQRSSILGGSLNCISNSGYLSAIGGGFQNHVCGPKSGIFSGEFNCIRTTSASYDLFIGSGGGNLITCITGGAIPCYSIIGGGWQNTVCGSCNSAILGGICNINCHNSSFVIGSCITTDTTCTTYVNKLSIKNIPTSSAGLCAGMVWSNSGVLTIVQI